MSEFCNGNEPVYKANRKSHVDEIATRPPIRYIRFWKVTLSRYISWKIGRARSAARGGKSVSHAARRYALGLILEELILKCWVKN